MPQWSRNDERQYEHIKQGQQRRGKKSKRAKEIAARTVNRSRREEGRTPQRSTQGTGNPNRRLDERSVGELRNRAAQLGIEGRSKMRKDDLVKAIRRKR